ncbi:hypothetical protein WA1_51645 [Scytonema hofmannii PCC 7110]|uniref:Actin-like protein N-terminal domain-containing protein n=1 Tax=Scytonema hofmannii PCC 7110 TaxID=128403 RepID=A0A139WPY6_9CYAN|nr:hypothetical protein [Scytonema hofmannii]KYC34499.1 hypothetical protein WA1_51645 [Scytonema hofmannii PCC 7110]
MPRKKGETAIQAAVEVQESQFGDVTVENAQITAETEPTEDTEKAAKTKKPRVSQPKKKVTLAIDAARSTKKYIAFLDGKAVTDVIRSDSLICQVDSSPFGELGSFSMSRGKGEDGKELIEHWVVGDSARFQGKPYIAMTDDPNHKITYFPILLLGALARLHTLYDLSSGASEKNRSLYLQLTTLSLAHPSQLFESVKQIKWLKVDGIKYKLNFDKAGFTGLPEGYGAALHAQQQLDKLKHPTFYVFDIGFGTSTVTEYSNLGKLPKRGACTPNGGGGIATLIREFAEATSQKDSSKLIKSSQLRKVLETSEWQNEKPIAKAPDGSEIGDVLAIAIKNWLRDSPVAYALESLSVIGRQHPIVVAGGGFSIPPVREMVQAELFKAGVPKDNLIIPENPGIVSLAELKRLYATNPEQAPELETLEDREALIDQSAIDPLNAGDISNEQKAA